MMTRLSIPSLRDGGVSTKSCFTTSRAAFDRPVLAAPSSTSPFSFFSSFLASTPLDCLFLRPSLSPILIRLESLDLERCVFRSRDLERALRSRDLDRCSATLRTLITAPAAARILDRPSRPRVDFWPEERCLTNGNGAAALRVVSLGSERCLISDRGAVLEVSLGFEVASKKALRGTWVPWVLSDAFVFSSDSSVFAVFAVLAADDVLEALDALEFLLILLSCLSRTPPSPLSSSSLLPLTSSFD
mmetsp:Transcript_11608/g.25122  ORF Transcript_11608/g.25122 Transcript_11608/m.25122 type:complete len:245 (-) Transcript_11608:502-1236(-)